MDKKVQKEVVMNIEEEKSPKSNKRKLPKRRDVFKKPFPDSPNPDTVLSETSEKEDNSPHIYDSSRRKNKRFIN